jgi:hypothetical protein
MVAVIVAVGAVGQGENIGGFDHAGVLGVSLCRVTGRDLRAGQE